MDPSRRFRGQTAARRATKGPAAKQEGGQSSTAPLGRREGVPVGLLDAGYHTQRCAPAIEAVERRMVESQLDEVHQVFRGRLETSIDVSAQGLIMTVMSVDTTFHDPCCCCK